MSLAQPPQQTSKSIHNKKTYLYYSDWYLIEAQAILSAWWMWIPNLKEGLKKRFARKQDGSNYRIHDYLQVTVHFPQCPSLTDCTKTVLNHQGTMN